MTMSLAAIIQNQVQDITKWDPAFLNAKLCVGDNLYTCISNSATKVVFFFFLLLTDIPQLISVHDKVSCLHCSNSLAGDVFMSSGTEPFFFPTSRSPIYCSCIHNGNFKDF